MTRPQPESSATSGGLPRRPRGGGGAARSRARPRRAPPPRRAPGRAPTRGRRRRRQPPPAGVSPSPARSTPRRFFRRPFPPPSPAKHIRASLAKRQGPPRPPEGPIPEEAAAASAASAAAGPEGERGLDKSFGYGKNFGAKYEIGKEVGRGHFGHTCSARAKKGEIRGHPVAVKIISKAKMTTPISIEDVRREVKILKSLSGHTNLVKFYDACEDALNVYIIMELCEGGELLDRILSRGGRYLEEDAKVIVVQILSVVAFCHLQGVVHRDLKPENFLFGTKEENSPMKLIDFGLSDFIRPDERLNDIVGSAYYVAPEVLHRPFWARTESGIFRSVLRADPNFDDSPWPSISPEAKDFVKRLLNKDYRKRMTAPQALSHPWLRDEQRQVPLDIFIYKLVKAYLRATPFKRAALKALSKAIPEDELMAVSPLENFRMALAENATEAMKESRVFDILHALEPLSYRRMDFEEFRAATISPYQLEALEGWEQIATTAFEFFEQEGNRVITIEELAQEMNLSPAAYSMVRDWIRPSDGKLSFLGYTKFLHGVTMRSGNTRHHHR
uniref:Protein kinase domain-containing protein n=1 Tax=Ananas comosus var. bracteatus TaxID=296719 RepID=A0A6V7Q078_ANACO|nr:unnamed protein product [Ananas comosus var. bracteatus]